MNLYTNHFWSFTRIIIWSFTRIIIWSFTWIIIWSFTRITFKFQRETANQTHKKNISSRYLYRGPEFPPLFFCIHREAMHWLPRYQEHLYTNHQLMRTLPATFKFQRETANQTLSSSYLYRGPEFPPLFFWCTSRSDALVPSISRTPLHESLIDENFIFFAEFIWIYLFSYAFFKFNINH